MESEKRHIWFCEVITLFGYISILSALYWLFSRSQTGSLMDPSTLLWYVSSLFSFFALRLYLRKERTLSQASIFTLVTFILQTTVLIALSTSISGFFGYSFAIIFWAIAAYQSYYFNVNGITLLQMTTMLECCVILLILQLFYQSAMGISIVYVLPLLSSVFLNLFGLIAMRTSDGERDSRFSGFRGVMVISCILLLLGVVILAFLMFAFAPVGDAVIAVYHGLVTAINFILRMIGKIILFLLSLLPQLEPGKMLGPEPAGPEAGTAEESLENPAIMEAIIIALGVIAVIVLISQIIRLRGVKIGGKTIRSSSRIKRTGDHFSKIFLLFLTRMKANVTFFVMTIRYRHTAPGLLIYLERWAKLHKKPRSSGETHRTFLTRLSEEESRTIAGLLTELSNALDIRYYSQTGSEFFSKETAMAIRKGFGKHNGKSAT